MTWRLKALWFIFAVTAIWALWTIYAPAPYTKYMARRMTTFSNAITLARALKAYVDANDDTFPPNVSQEQLATILNVEPMYFRSLNPKGGALQINPALAGRRLKDLRLYQSIRVFEEPNPWDDGRRASSNFDQQRAPRALWLWTK